MKSEFTAAIATHRRRLMKGINVGWDALQYPYSLQSIAPKIGVSVAAVKGWDNGNRYPATMGELSRWAKTVGLNFNVKLDVPMAFTPRYDRKIEDNLVSGLTERRQGLFFDNSSDPKSKNPYSIRAVSQRIGVAQTTVTYWENGVSYPSTAELWRRWARAVDADIEFRLDVV